MVSGSIEVVPSPANGDAAPAAATGGARGRPRGKTVLVPQLSDLVFITLAALLPTFYYVRLMFSDGDMLRHVRLGEWMLEHRALLTVDVFSYTRGGAPFTAYEWLSELFFGALHGAGGLAAVALGSAAVIAAAYALVMKWMLRRGVGHWTAVGALAYAMVLGNVHWLARPHMFSYLGCAAVLWLLESRSRFPLLLAMLLSAVWVNLHPGAFVGFTLLGVVAAGETLEVATRGEPLWPGRTRRIWLLWLGSGLGLLVTPQGPGLVLHALRTLGDATLMNITGEFLSPDMHEYWGKALMAGVLGGAVIFALKRERPPYAVLGVFLLFASAALMYRRNIPFFGLVAVPFLLAWPALHRSVPAIERLARPLRTGDQLARGGVWSGAFALAMAALVATGGTVGGARLVPSTVCPKRFPVAAVAWAREHGVTGRMFHDQAWGSYVLYAWPEQPIFMDGATDFFGPAVAREYVEVTWLAEGWQDRLSARGISLALLPVGEPLPAALERYAGWRPLYRDSVAVLLRAP